MPLKRDKKVKVVPPKILCSSFTYLLPPILTYLGSWVVTFDRSRNKLPPPPPALTKINNYHGPPPPPMDMKIEKVVRTKKQQQHNSSTMADVLSE